MGATARSGTAGLAAAMTTGCSHAIRARGAGANEDAQAATSWSVRLAREDASTARRASRPAWRERRWPGAAAVLRRTVEPTEAARAGAAREAPAVRAAALRVLPVAAGTAEEAATSTADSASRRAIEPTV